MSWRSVSGTNGKTTTRTPAGRGAATRGPVVSNGGGANLPTGLTAALTADRTSRVGVLEVDEPFLPKVAAAVKPRAVVLLNLSRDQLDRYAEVRRLAGHLARALKACPDDPRRRQRRRPARRVGRIRGARTSPGSRPVSAGPTTRPPARRAATSCIRDGEGGWRSDGCGLSRPTPAWRVDGRSRDRPVRARRHGVELASRCTSTSATPRSPRPPRLSGGVEPRRRVRARWRRSRRSKAATCRRRTRADRCGCCSRRTRPAGRRRCTMARPDAGLVVAVNARAADGRDPSWLWDVPFEVLRGRHAVATGERPRDVAVRLRYAGVEHVRRRRPGAGRCRAAHGSGPSRCSPTTRPSRAIARSSRDA